MKRLTRILLIFCVIALIAMAGILLEIALTRVYSSLFFYHYTFAILAIALLGIGLGAALAHQRYTFRSGYQLSVLLQHLSLLAAAAILMLAVLILITVSVDNRLLLIGLSALPYVLIGMMLATIFAARSQQSHILYAADLGGAALGALAAIPLLNLVGAFDALLVIALLFILVSAVSRLAFERTVPSPEVARKKQRGIWIISGALSLFALGMLFVGFTPDVSHLSTPKPLTLALQNDPEASIVDTTWDAFARTDVVQSEDDPAQMLVFIDGAAGSAMPRYPLTFEDEQRLKEGIGYFPFTDTPESVYIIGPGGGLDILYALLAGSDEITAVEVSPGVVDAVRRHEDYNGKLYDHPSVTLAVDEGRSHLQRGDDLFDLIYLSEVVTLTAEPNSYMLAENYVYTVEAIQDFWKHLTPGGSIAIKLYDELTLTRAFTTAMQALKEIGLSEQEAMQRLVVLLDSRLVSDETPFRSPMLILYRDGLTPQDAKGLLSSSEEAGLIPLLIPHVVERPPLAALISGETTLAGMIAGFERGDISPTRDNAPFFYEFRRGLPDVLRTLLVVMGIIGIIGIAYLWWRGRSMTGPYWSVALYFGLLGAGFMLAEIAMIQRFTLLLGHPVRALTVGLAVILFSGGLGSLIGGIWAIDRWGRFILLASLTSAGLLLIYALGPLQILIDNVSGWTLTGRVLIVILMVAPLFFFLGIPFPLGLQLTGRRRSPAMVPLAWSITGVTAVMGAVAAMVIALLWNFDVVLVAAAVIYLCVALLLLAILRT